MTTTTGPRRVPFIPRQDGTEYMLASMAGVSLLAMMIAPAVAPAAAVLTGVLAALTLVPVRPDHENDRALGSVEIGKAEGSFLRAFPRPLRFDRNTLSNGVIVTGEKSPLRTEVLMSMAQDVIASGGGLIYIDHSGDLGCFNRLSLYASDQEREDDVFLLNNKGPVSQHEKPNDGLVKTTNTWNPIAGLTAPEIARLVGQIARTSEHVQSSMSSMRGAMFGLSSIRDPAEGNRIRPNFESYLSDPEGSPMLRDQDTSWHDRIERLVHAVACIATYKAAETCMPVGFDMLRNMLDCDSLIGTYEDTSIPAFERAPLHLYLHSISGFVREKGGRQSQSVLDSHGYVQMQVTKLLGHFIDVFGPWCGSSPQHGDLTMTDIVNGRRILHVVADHRDDDLGIVPVLVRSTLEMALAKHRSQTHLEADRPFVVFQAGATEDEQVAWMKMARVQDGRVGYVTSCKEDGFSTSSHVVDAAAGAIVVMDDGTKGNPRVVGGVVIPSGSRVGNAVVVMNGSSTSIRCNYRGVSHRDYRELDVALSNFMSTPKELLV